METDNMFLRAGRLKYVMFISLFLLAGIERSSAFALLGPFAPWMTTELSYQDGASIGGPMNLGEGYRWNVPVVTYAFDASFLDYFGTSGVAAVESSIGILNALPPASQLNPGDYPANTTKINVEAQSRSLLDLQSAALSLLLEQMGLAQPQRFAFTLRDYSREGDMTNYTVIMRNFDPGSLAPSALVNGTEYGYSVTYHTSGLSYVADTTEFAIDPLATTHTAVADGVPVSGYFFTGLTYDDVAGLSYLLKSNRFVMEGLLPGVHGVGTNSDNFVTNAIRAGVDKVTFQRVAYDQLLGKLFSPFTNQYVEHYRSNNAVHAQTLERVITQPDIMFTAHFTGVPVVTRTGTTNWVNNGAPAQDGPGVIQPPIEINFNQLWHNILNFSGVYPPPDNLLLHGPAWGSYNSSTNAPMSYPTRPGTTAAMHLLLISSISMPQIYHEATWDITAFPGTRLYALQTSTDLTNWITVITITNSGKDFVYGDRIFPDTPSRYFRTIRLIP